MAINGFHFGVLAPAMSTDPRQAVRMSRELGFSGSLFDSISAAGDLTRLSGSGRREFRHVLSGQDQQLIGLRTDLGAKGLGPGADVDQVIARLAAVMEAAAGLGSPLVCVELEPLPAARPDTPPKPKVTPEQAGLILLPESFASPAVQPDPPAPADPAFTGQVNAALAEIGRHADRYSTVLAFRSDLASFASIEAALRQTSCPWFGVDLDPVAVLRDRWDLNEIFSRLGPFIRHVRGRDALKGAGGRTKPAPVGQGSVPWEQLLDDLQGTDYRGWITLDPVDLTDRIEAARAGLKFLRTLAR